MSFEPVEIEIEELTAEDEALLAKYEEYTQVKRQVELEEQNLNALKQPTKLEQYWAGSITSSVKADTKKGRVRKINL